MISPLAYIHPEAKIGENVEIGPFCYVDRGVEIGDNNTLMNSVTVLYGFLTYFIGGIRIRMDSQYLYLSMFLQAVPCFLCPTAVQTPSICF